MSIWSDGSEHHKVLQWRPEVDRRCLTVSHHCHQTVQRPKHCHTKCNLKLNLCAMLLILQSFHHVQQTITANNMVNITTQLQTLVSQATQEVDQSVFNLAVVTNVISQISNISSPEVPIQAEVYCTPFIYM